MMNEPFIVKAINSKHADIVHDIAFNATGQRMATCSSDHSVQVYNLNSKGEFELSSSLPVHNGAVWRVTWAHPEFGQILATCSFDRTAAVWEDTITLISEHSKMLGEHFKYNWTQKGKMVDSRMSVTDVKFAPRYHGLILAACSADCNIRIYEAPDIMNLRNWTLQHEINCHMPCSCISWLPSRFHQIIAVGSNDTEHKEPKVKIFELNQNDRRYSLAETLHSILDPVQDVSFAPNMGRSYQLLAVASKNLHIFTLHPISRDSVEAGTHKYEIRIAACFGGQDYHGSQVWRVSWNTTGTILASTGEDNTVRMWKSSHLGVWHCISATKTSNGTTIEYFNQPGIKFNQFRKISVNEVYDELNFIVRRTRLLFEYFNKADTTMLENAHGQKLKTGQTPKKQVNFSNY